MPRISPRLVAAFAATALVAPLQAVTVGDAHADTPVVDIVVSRVGDGSTALGSGAAPVFLDEYSPDGTLVHTTPMPTDVSGAQHRLTMSGSASSEGALALSADGRFVTLAGYDAAVGTAGVAGTSGATVNRVVGRLGGDGTVDTSTATTSLGSNNVRGAASDDGVHFWLAGAGGVHYLATLGASSSTAIATLNARVPTISAGQLYVSSGSAATSGLNAVGSGLPTATAATTVVPGTASTSPYGSAFLDRDGVAGADALYVADDSAAIGLTKLALVAGSWVKQGTYAGSGGLRGVTATTQNGQVVLWAVTSTGSLVKLTDSAAFDAAPDIVAGTPITAGANRVFRGVAAAPAAATTPTGIATQPQDVSVTSGSAATLTVSATGTNLRYQWFDSAPIAAATAATFTTPALTTTSTYFVRVTGDAGSADSRTATVTVTPATSTNTPPTISVSATATFPLTIADPDGAPSTRTVTVADDESAIETLSTSVASSNDAVATATTTGTGGVRSVVVAPQGVGYATLTVTVSDGELSASAQLRVAVSGPLPVGTSNLYGASDASTAIALTGNLMAVGDDENNTLRVYDRAASGYPVASFDLREAGLSLRDADPTREIDIEASATKAGTTFWVGSHGQNKDAKTRLNRQELFTTTASGSTLSVGGSYQHLRDDMIAWDNGRAAPLGLGAAASRAPEGDGTGATGFYIEGAEFSNDGSSLFVGFRGPLTSDGNAIVVPLTNPDALVAANPTTNAAASFGEPLTWDLGGRGIREMRRSADGSYVVIAGASGASGPSFALYRWDGVAAHEPLPLSADLRTLSSHGSPEAIVEVPNPLGAASQVQLITDSGDEVWYADGAPAKSLDLAIRKATSARVAVGATPVCTGYPTTIGSVQGSGDASPVVGSTVTIRGTVVSDDEGPSPALRGIYLQDAGDDDSATSDGIFVFEGSTDRGLHNGDVLQVTGVVSEFQGQTQVTANTVDNCGRSATVTPTDVTLPQATANALERVEGMLVRFHQTLTVTEHFQLGRFGQVVLSSGGKLQQPTSVYRPGAEAEALRAANAVNRIIVDDALQSQNPDPIAFGRGGQPLSASNTLRGGDTTTDPVGVMTYTWAGNAASGNAYRLRPLEALGGTIAFDPTNPRPVAPPAVGTGGVRVASANLLNFFTAYSGCTGGITGAPLDCRGADNGAEYERQLAKEVASLRFLKADVIGFMEMANNGYGPTSAEQALVDALNAADGADTWKFIDADAATGVVDVMGDDAIKVGMLYRASVVTPGKTFVDDVDQFERHPLAQEFSTPAGARFTVVANHWKSKGSCPTSGPDTDQADGQSCWNARRTAQAHELARWIDTTVVPGVGDPDVLILGDLNSYAMEDPIVALESNGYVNLSVPDAYSYVFDGQWGYLDHMLASASLRTQVTGEGDAHHNSDEPAVLDYNTNFKSAAQVTSLYAPDRFRTSDHDPVLVGLDLGVGASVSGSLPDGTVGTAYAGPIDVTGTLPLALTLTSGTLPTGLAITGTSLSGTPRAAGTFTFTVTASNAYGSAAKSFTVSIARSVSTTTLTSSAPTSTSGAPIRFTAAVSGSTGTVTFAVDGVTLGSPVAIVGGTAVSADTSTLPAGLHTVTATYSGDVDSQPSSASLQQLVRYGVRVVVPTVAGAYPAGWALPIAIQLTNSSGSPIPDAEARSVLAGSCALRVSATGAQTLASSCPTYVARAKSFGFVWVTARQPRGATTLAVTMTYAGAAPQVVTVAVRLT